MSSSVAILFAISGEYEDYRARTCEVYASVDAAKREAERRNALVVPAREKLRAAWDLPAEQYDLSEKRAKRILAKLRRETTDSEIESHDVGDLHYSVNEARLVK